MLQKAVQFADVVTSTITGNPHHYKMEVRKPNGEVCFYTLRALDLSDAQHEARLLVSLLDKNERVIWRLAGDNTWNLGAGPIKQTTFKQRLKKALDQFFYIEEE